MDRPTPNGGQSPPWAAPHPPNQPVQDHVQHPVQDPQPPLPVRPPVVHQPQPEPTPTAPANSGETSSNSGATDWAPKPKIAAAAVSVPFSGLLLWGTEYFTNISLPAQAAGDVAALVAVVVAYFTPGQG
jgi:hypothetical protein